MHPFFNMFSALMKCEHTEGKGHDCQMVDAINKYIPQAEKKADKEAKNDEDWNRIFHMEMARLTKQFRHFSFQTGLQMKEVN
jgi:hypothetical protein